MAILGSFTALRVSLLSVLSGDAGEQGILPDLVYSLGQAFCESTVFSLQPGLLCPDLGCCDLCNGTEEAVHPHVSASLPCFLEQPTLPHYDMGSKKAKGS